jgi:predicted transcriptional regulator
MGDLSLRRSKLETCLSILEILGSRGPLKITHVMQKANVNCNVLKNYFDFLIKQGAVEEKCVEREKIVYAITERGLYLIKCFKELNQMIPTVKINTKAKNELNQNEQKYIVNLQKSSLVNGWKNELIS